MNDLHIPFASGSVASGTGNSIVEHRAAGHDLRSGIRQSAAGISARATQDQNGARQHTPEI